MKVRISKFKHNYTMPGIAKLFKYTGLPDEKVEAVYLHLKHSNIARKALRFINRVRKNRKISVKVERYDVWAATETIALVVVPILEKLKEAKNGVPIVDDEDVPDHLTRLTERWDWILNEMIWAFQSFIDGHEVQKQQASAPDNVRTDNGLRLFSKYYHSLWS